MSAGWTLPPGNDANEALAIGKSGIRYFMFLISLSISSNSYIRSDITPPEIPFGRLECTFKAIFEPFLFWVFLRYLNIPLHLLTRSCLISGSSGNEFWSEGFWEMESIILRRLLVLSKLWFICIFNPRNYSKLFSKSLSVYLNSCMGVRVASNVAWGLMCRLRLGFGVAPIELPTALTLADANDAMTGSWSCICFWCFYLSVSIWFMDLPRNGDSWS